MDHEGNRLDREIERLERELEGPIDAARRRRIQEAIAHLRVKKRNWQSPH